MLSEQVIEKKKTPKNLQGDSGPASPPVLQVYKCLFLISSELNLIFHS